MKWSTSLLFVVVGCLASGLSFADAVNEFSDAQRIVVITEDEGIHYARGCAFYEFRDLLAENVGNDSAPAAATAPQLYEIRMLGKFGERTVYLGDRRIQTAEGTVSVPTDTYDRMVELIEKRKGQGVAAANVDTSVKRALIQIQDPAYVEEKRCSNR